MSYEEKADSLKDSAEVVQVSELPASDYPDVKQTKRDLKPRHIQLIAISGAIGTGLFVGTGHSLARAGPLGLLLGYSIYGALVLISFNSMGEMVSYLPIDGSYAAYAERFVDKSFGFSVGWIVFYNYATTVAAEATAVASVINYWNDSINNAVWCTLFLASVLLVNIFGVKFFGEGEFYFSIFKVLLITGLLIFTFITMVGGNPQHDAFGFRYWKDPGPLNAYIAEGGWGKFLAFYSTFVSAAYAYGGPDYLALTAGEAKYPRRVMPVVFSRVLWRLLVFYIFGVLSVGILVPYDDISLGASLKGAGSSPFVIGMVRMGITTLPSVVNACIMTSAWSCGLANSFTASRVLYSLALRREAPRIFARTYKGVPVYALLLVIAFGCLSFLSIASSAATAFSYILNITGALWIVNMALQQIIYIRFRSGVAAQAIDRSQFPFFKKHQLYFSWIAFFAYTFLFLTNGFYVFTKGKWTVEDFLFAYLTVPLLTALYFGHKAYTVIRGGSWRSTPPDQVDLTTGLDEIEADMENYPPLPTTRWGRFLAWLWGA